MTDPGIGVAAVIALLSLSPTLSVSQTPRPGSSDALVRFMAADEAGKRKMIEDVAGVAEPPAGSEFEQLISAALKDGSADLREVALNSILIRTGGMGAVIASVAKQNQARLRALTADVVAALDDDDFNVRVAATGALVSLWQDRDLPNDINRPTPQVTQVLVSHYDRESVPAVRAGIVRVFSHTVDNAPAQQLVLRALAETSIQVLVEAVRGAGLLRLISSLPRVSALLSSPDPALRMASVEALARFGAIARAELPAMQSALQSEADVSIRRTLESVIQQIDR